ncbi:ATP-grasp domain-containing protein [Bifidobacterium sp. SMB2]|uniref:ATP-grasp domain-containing protein n=1 Tax=Bifidobacterium saimiriisciurei TaxID=2661627 RepID=A0ABX0C7R9_9BIFI|nr:MULTISPECIES: ATP-grasp domain-containing protein [Bifidobacterium]NEG95755.1 ATP-grasp domain-containing protein [Bifidobacterium sp. SMB2]NEH11182.1 ATP-grasp domain-containing protein [Bifidobacterium saimiriisciurei]
MASFQPIILGGDLGAYALARELNDAYGVKPIMVTAYNPNAIRDSAIITRHEFAEANEEGPLIEELLRLGKDLKTRNPKRRLLLLANTDWRIHVLASHREELERYYVVPIPPLDVIEQVSDKQGFERLATAQGMPVPKSFYEDFSGADTNGWQPQPTPADLTFPVVAKPADSSEYENLMFEGRQKVYRIDTNEQLTDLWRKLAEAGFRGTFVAQELVEGDDTEMYSVTAYVDSTGTVSLLCSARVLLEEHHPATLGNPCAMITEPIDEILQPAKRFLESLPYRGFANFDVKRDPNTGRFYFLEVNPRIGRNSFYVYGAGINPMEVLVSDVIDGHPMAPRVADGEVLYSIIPDRLLLRYVVDPDLKAQVRRLQKAGRINPQRNPKDGGFKRWLHLTESELNQYRKFGRYYPKPTNTGF